MKEGLQPTSPEGLTPNQEILAGMLFDTKTVAPVNRRLQLSDGTLEFHKTERPTSPIDFAQEGEFALKLHETSPDAPLSPVYINLRNLPEKLEDHVGVVLAEVPTPERPDFCAGIPKAGVPLAEAYSRHSGIPVINIFEKEEAGATRRIVAGQPGASRRQKVRIIDDLATRGDTKLEAIRAAEQMGYEVTDVLVLVDRQQGAVEQLKAAGYTLRAAFIIDRPLRFGVRTGRITQEQYAEAASYLGLKG